MQAQSFSNHRTQTPTRLRITAWRGYYSYHTVSSPPLGAANCNESINRKWSYNVICSRNNDARPAVIQLAIDSQLACPMGWATWGKTRQKNYSSTFYTNPMFLIDRKSWRSKILWRLVYYKIIDFLSSCFLFKTQRFGDWILSPSSGKSLLSWAQSIGLSPSLDTSTDTR
jgi:hypothetical protein